MTDQPSQPDARYSPPPASPAPHDPAAYPISGAGAASVPASPPGRGLSIAGLILAFLVPPLGLILSAVAAVKLGKAGAPRGMAIAGIIIGAVLTLLEIIGVILLVTVFAGLFSMCAELGPGVWEIDGVTYTCG